MNIAGYMHLSRCDLEFESNAYGFREKLIRVELDDEEWARYKDRLLGESVEWNGELWFFRGTI